MAALPMILRLAALPMLHIPEPAVHDEFSYLLGADTFASGRLTNPPHPMWVHFETEHVNFQPTYASKYPPGQAIFLAAGQKFLGHPWFGVWLSFGVMCACLCWMLQGWLPPLYALLGTLVAIGQIGIFRYWMNSYWGGAVTAAGGCLVMGAMARVVRGRGRPGAAILGAIGLLILANTRPYEGGVTAAAAGIALLWWSRRRGRKHLGLGARRSAIAFLAVCGIGIVGMAYYNYRVTNSAFEMPYTLNNRLYAAYPHFYLLPARQHLPVYHHETLRKFWVDWDGTFYHASRKDPLVAVFGILGLAATLPFYFSTLGSWAFVVGVLFSKSVKVRVALAILAVLCFATLLETAVLAHYLAPAMGLVFVPEMYALRWLRVHGMKLGAAAVLLFVAVVFGSGLYQGLVAYHSRAESPVRPIIERLTSAAARNLVIVRYAPSHDTRVDYVYNRADIDASAIVWARDMGDARNRELIDYYPDRKVWLFQPDTTPFSLVPYRESTTEPAQAKQNEAR